MSRNLFLIPVWKRPEITRICLENLILQNQGILCICSRVSDSELCYSLGVPYVMFPNEFLGAKWNHGLKAAKSMDWDYLVTLGSDDIIKTSLLDFYEDAKQTDILITDKIHFIDVPTGRASLLTRARIGAGRRISRKVIEACKWTLWSDYKNKSLDMDSNAAINRAGYATAEQRTIPHIVGLKSDINIWNYEHVLHHGNQTEMSDALVGVPDAIKSKISDLLKSQQK